MDGEMIPERPPNYSLASLKTSMRNVEFPWVLAQYRPKKKEQPTSATKPIWGSLGLMDWCFNGQISKTIFRGQLQNNTLTLFPNFPNKKSSSLLLYCPENSIAKNPKNTLKSLILSLQKLRIKNLHLLESTWQTKPLEELKRNLSAAGIKFSSLEKKSWEI